MTRSLLGILAAAAVLFAGGAAFAEPQDWQWGFQPAASPIAEDIHSFYDYVLLPMMVIISAFVAVLMGWIMFRFAKRRNPNPARTTHNTLLEVVWTGLPILILIGIAVPSLRLLYYEATIPEAALTLKATGHQWYWSYEYPDQGGISFDAIMVDEAEWNRLHTEHGIIPPKDYRPVPWEMMLFDGDTADGLQRVGHTTSFMWSPVLQRHIGMARVEPRLAAPGSEVRVEITIDHRYQTVAAKVARAPLFDPPRKTATP